MSSNFAMIVKMLILQMVWLLCVLTYWTTECDWHKRNYVGYVMDPKKFHLCIGVWFLGVPVVGVIGYFLCH